MTDYGMSDTTNLTGRQIGRYLLQAQIGAGGVATVYQAYDQVEGRSVALKVLLPTADANTVSRFRREALTAGALRHPNIVRIYQVGTALQGDVAYIAGLQSDYAANGVYHPDTNPTGEVLDPGYLYEVKNIPDFNKTSDTRVELVGVIKI